MEKRGSKRYKHNPSISIIGHLLWYTKKVIKQVKKEPGKYKGLSTEIITQNAVEVIIDKSPFIKVYLDSNTLTEFSELSKTAQQVLCYIVQNKLELDKSYFYFYAPSMAESEGVSENTASNGVRELLEKEWIFKGDEPCKYFINLLLLSYGNREEVYKREYDAVK